jgi:hypothetical protein
LETAPFPRRALLRLFLLFVIVQRDDVVEESLELLALFKRKEVLLAEAFKPLLVLLRERGVKLVQCVLRGRLAWRSFL